MSSQEGYDGEEDGTNSVSNLVADSSEEYFPKHFNK